MADEKDAHGDLGAKAFNRRASDTTESTAIDKLTNVDSDEALKKEKESEEDGASYAAIKPAHAPAASRPQPPAARSLAHSRSNRSVASTTRSTRVRSHNGYGCDDDNHSDDENGQGEDDGVFSPDTDQEAQRARSQDKDPFEVVFEGGNQDPWNPRSMRTWRKWMIVGLASAGSFCVTCASSIYTSSYTQMNAEFGNSQIVATLGLSMFVLGLALGPVWSPLSEFYGRRPIYLAAFASFTIWIIPCAVAKNIETVVIARFFQGLAGSAFLSVSGGTVSDLFVPEKMHHPMTLFTVAPFTGPCVGPLIGGFINSNINWRWTHYVMIIWAFCEFLVIVFLVPETYHPVVLRKKAQKKREETKDDRWKAPIEKSTKSFSQALGNALLRPFEILLFEPMALILDIYSAILLGILYLFFGAFAVVYEGVYGFELWQVGLTFLGLLVGLFAGAMSSGLWQGVRARLIARNGGKIEPEFRLPSVIVGAAFVTVGLFWFAWTTLRWVHWIVPVIGSAIFGCGVILAFSGTFTYLVETYPSFAASALAANALVRCAFAAAFPLFGMQMYNTLGDQWATSVLAFLTAAMLPFPYLFFLFGKRIRAHSRMAKAD